jgi:hypothetical protein
MFCSSIHRDDLADLSVSVAEMLFADPQNPSEVSQVRG